MSGVVAFIRRCVAAGMDYETALLAAEQYEASPPAPTRGAMRQRRYRERHQASPVTPSDVGDGGDERVLETKVSPTPPSKTQSPKSPPSPPTGAHGSSEFEAFWAIWPDRRNVGAARRAYPGARAKASQAQILAAVPNVSQTRAWQEGKRVHASTWLNGERWLDPPEEAATGPPPRYSPSQLQAASDELAFRMAKDELARRNYGGNQGVIVPLPEARQIGGR